MQHIGIYPPGVKDSDPFFNTPPQRLVQPYSAFVTYEENGPWTLELTMSAKDLDALDCTTDQCVFLAKTPEGMQPFRLRYAEHDGDIVTVKAPHVFFDGDFSLITDAYCAPIGGGQANRLASDAVNTILNYYATANSLYCRNPYRSISADNTITATNTYRMTNVAVSDALLEICERWKCWLRPNRFNAVLTGTRGRQTGYVIRYGVNMIGASVSYDWSDVAWAICAVGDNGIVERDGNNRPLPVYDIHRAQFNTCKFVSRDYATGIDQQDFEATVRAAHPTWTDEQVEQAYRDAVIDEITRQAYVDLDRFADASGTRYTPAINYTVEGYVDAGTTIRVGDSVRCVDPRYGLDLTAACVAYVYDELTETYRSIQFGDFKRSLRSLRPGN